MMGGSKSAAGKDTMQVYMVSQLLVPRVKHLDDSGYCPEVLFVLRKFQKCFGAASVEKPIQEWLVTVDEGI